MKRLSLFLLGLYALFPLTDFLLRRVLGLGGLAGLWDKGLLALLFVLAWLQADRERLRRLRPLAAPLGLFFALGVLHLGIDLPNFAATFDGFRAVYFYMLALFVGAWLPKTRDDVERIMAVLAGLGALAGAVGLAQVALGVRTPAGWTDVTEATSRRAFSFVVSPNVLGSYMAYALLLTLALAWRARAEGRRRALLVYLLFAALEAAALVLSGSRGAWLAFFLAALVVLFFFRPRLSLAAAAALIALAALLPPIRRRMEALLSPMYWEKSARDGRIARWLGSFHQMRFDPLFGRGIGHYGGATGNRFFGTTYVDGYYFKTMAEMGLPGLILFVWLMVAVFRTLFARWQAARGRPEGALLLGLLAADLAVALHNAVENIFEVPFMNAYFWLAAGLALALSPGRPEEGRG
ncbi:MAG: O-antigen polymerase [Hydrogenibacillus schlegelii]|uniref:O-antigen polymerase n=1 Tax=Hydrogenibacillus schlegelii TaxID=1484 RepID=A0A2T5GBS7_HYDSH|nr:O-antigen ligase family protein [Hydrogenibacillus schlegelii]PTQ53639.1 MAG: O-antigen polymerase [Hydrogenibacillus schlegelii]